MQIYFFVYILQKHSAKDTRTRKKEKKKKEGTNTQRQDVVVTGMFCDGSLYWIQKHFSTLYVYKSQTCYKNLEHKT